MSDTPTIPSRHGLLARGTAALLTGAAIATAEKVRQVDAPHGADAELIRLCDRVAQLSNNYDALTLARHTREDEERTEPLLDAINAEQAEIWERLDEIGLPTTTAGATAMARAAFAEWPKNRDGSLTASYLAEWLAASVLEFHAGRAAA